MFAWTWNDKCLPYAFMLALMASDDGYGWYGLSKRINIGTCMHSKEIEHQANADQRHMSFTWAWKAHNPNLKILRYSHFET